MQKVIIGVVVSFLLALSFHTAAQDVEFGSALIRIKDKALTVEYASTFEQRAQGLMFRQTLCKDCGMLFRYDSERIAGMWMKNTLLPLDVAFIDTDGIIVDIKTMQPHDLTTVKSTKPVLFALEMNQNWFAQNAVEEGEFVSIGPLIN